MRSLSGLLAVASVLFLACGSGVGVHAQTSAAAAAAAGQFGYTGDDGPAFWAESAHAPLCGASLFGRQSPIDLSFAIPDQRLAPLDLDLQETSVVLSNPGYNVTTIAQERQVLTLDGEPYKLLQFHFHTLSEHTVDGRQGVMELHVVFQDEATEKKLAVIGVIYKMGRSNPFLQKLLAKGLPQKSTSPNQVVGSIDLSKAFTDLSRYYTYAGSLTTPPCGQNVQWLVLENWAEMSAQQFQSFHDVLGNNFRPLQRRNLRAIHKTVR
jgi:carbonic anhydrase